MCGMSYSLNDEPKIMQAIIESNYDINLVSAYADEVCVKNAQNQVFLEEQLKNSNWMSEEKLQQFKHTLNNPTSLGNMAYLALHAPEPYSDISRKIYQQIIEIVRGEPIDNEIETPPSGWFTLIMDVIERYPLLFILIVVFIIIVIIKQII
jgi:hypothetical protein